jgi:L-arabinokinase
LDSSIFDMYLARDFDESSLAGKYFCHKRTLDSGAIQAHALKVDPVQTLEHYATIHEKRSELIESEVIFLGSRSFDLIIVDATPIACAAGYRAGVKVLLLSNFSWDFCYRGMFDEIKSSFDDPTSLRYTAMIEQCAADYCNCDIYLQLPGKAALPPNFDESKVKEGPLLSRHAKLSRDEVRKAHNLDSSVKLLLVGFGGHSSAWDLHESALPEGWKCLVLGAEDGQLPYSNRFIPIDFNCYVPDLIAASDVMLGKLGYGLVSECLTADVPLIYVPRSSWPEEACLEDYLLSHQGGLKMPAEAFFSGDWSDYLTRALALKESERISTFSAPEDAVMDIFSNESVVALLGRNILE